LRWPDAELWRDAVTSDRRPPAYWLTPPRSRMIARLALVVGVMAAGHLGSGASMVQECPLTAPLILEDLQAGFVGQTGMVWTIAPDCSFTVARQIGANTADPHKQGQLTSDQEKRLAALLARPEFAVLPGRLGGVPQPNAHQITVTYGQTRCVLTLAPPGGNPDPLRQAGDPRVTWMLELDDVLKDMIGI
jgi:hypothetical protein